MGTVQSEKKPRKLARDTARQQPAGRKKTEKKPQDTARDTTPQKSTGSKKKIEADTKGVPKTYKPPLPPKKRSGSAATSTTTPDQTPAPSVASSIRQEDAGTVRHQLQPRIEHGGSARAATTAAVATPSGPASPATATPTAALPPGTKAQQGPFAHAVLNTILVDPAAANPQSADNPEYQETATRFIDLVNNLYVESDTFRKIADNYAQQTKGKQVGVFFAPASLTPQAFHTPHEATGASSRVQMPLNEAYMNATVSARDVLMDGSSAPSKDYTWERFLVHELGHAFTGLGDFTLTDKEWLATFKPDFVASAAKADLNYANSLDPITRGILNARSTFMPGDNERLINTIMNESTTYHDDTPVGAYSGVLLSNPRSVIPAYDTIRRVLKKRLPKGEFKEVFNGLPKSLAEFSRAAAADELSDDDIETIRTNVHGAWVKEYPRILDEDGADGHYDSLYGTFEQYQARINALLAQLP